ncbi:MAG TPA: bifunctional DNA-formamidopyrimidine glycosylase/DNA-(apurinic or apyrimidinic site) lyase [Acidiferrobacteraceae bacterium]|nr:bifunctional DNA-formamidopyrimidine glycosylase/DNA-(apurinic or apyrimidinic site) lyase [Acidiferrobacteraceae bacterium]HEX20406.1 bifunctional DNA-formamidopyrimidine glycosylase/DNA-(apurinic or apyrimidinic site) lyase [Acidiferrobacteraceae bacterium]
MPELPEVETTCRGLRPQLLQQRITAVKIHNASLRWPIPQTLKRQLPGQTIHNITRRAKYLLISVDSGQLILHLGMSGSLRVLPLSAPRHRHEHFEIVLQNQQCLRLRDPRRFGAVLWGGPDALQHPLLASLGPEPLSPAFHAAYMYQVSRQRQRAIRDLLLYSRIVSGIGNIYANEALFRAGIRPQTAAGKISMKRYTVLIEAVRHILQQAIEAGGTTLRDFTQSDGNPGYFQQQLRVYGRDGQACPQCQRPIRKQKLHGRTAYYCSNCQR